jgi:hypothetical protein
MSVSPVDSSSVQPKVAYQPPAQPNDANNAAPVPTQPAGRSATLTGIGKVVDIMA